MDACSLTYPDNYFDIVIDKTTIDSILCGESETFTTVALMLKEAQRVIKEENGYYITISFGTPKNR